MDIDTAPPRRRAVALQLPASAGAALKLIAGAVVVAALYFGREILVPLALAALAGFVLDPLVSRLRRWRLPRGLAVAVVMVATLAAVGGASLLVARQLAQLGQDLPRYQQTIGQKLRALRADVSRAGPLDSATRLIGAVETEVDATRRALEAKTAAPARSPARVQVVATEPTPLRALGAWLTPVVEPLLTGGIAVVLLVFLLLERHDLRDRLVRLTGSELHQMSDALGEAARRVSRYLTMQLLVNLGYGLPLAAGLWLIGVPGALLWGALAAVLRFVPYLGPVVAAVFPLALAFAVDPGWNMLLWTLGLVLALELLSNNLVEPWLYGASTGLSPVAVLLSAAFWTLLWGPAGLVLATPLTVCLVVMGRHLPQLQFLDLLLGHRPVFDPPTRLYQRLLAGDLEEAADLAEAQVADHGLAGFYGRTAVPALGLAATAHALAARAEHRHRVAQGMKLLLDALEADHPAADGPPAVRCIGLRHEDDALAARMLAHALARDGVAACAPPMGARDGPAAAQPDLRGVRVVCLSSFHPQPGAMARQLCRRLHRQHPGLTIVLALWQAPPEALEPGTASALGADALAGTLQQAVQRSRAALGVAAPGPAPENSPRDAALPFLLPGIAPEADSAASQRPTPGHWAV